MSGYRAKSANSKNGGIDVEQNKNETGGIWMERKRLGMLVIAILLAGIALAAMPVEAKTYNPFMGHSAVQYENKDIMSELRHYVDHVEYDTVYGRGNGYGCRLYLTDAGVKAIQKWDLSLLNIVTYSVMGASEWKQERTLYSVKEEIWFHAWIGKDVVGIEYYYQDLKSYEYWRNM